VCDIRVRDKGNDCKCVYERERESEAGDFNATVFMVIVIIYCHLCFSPTKTKFSSKNFHLSLSLFFRNVLCWSWSYREIQGV